MSAPLKRGQFDVSGITIDPRTGKIDDSAVLIHKGALDFPTAAELCRCCGLELLQSGCKWSVWFCNDCKPRVLKLNQSVGAWVIPIRRHSLMHGLSYSPPTRWIL